MNFADFATEKFPLHPSGMRGLIVCPWRVVMRFLELAATGDEAGPAADTGSATHAAIAAFHRGSDPAASLASMQARLGEYPQADLNDAAGMFLAYAADTRNRTAKVLLVEQLVKFRIDPAEEDPTQQAIEVVGTVDQVRVESDGIPRVWDVKTSKRDPSDLLCSHTVQLAAYCVGASMALGRNVEPGGLIVMRKYLAGKNPFWSSVWTLADTEHILRAVRHAVAAVRAGKIWHNPNDDCKWCHARTPDLCLPKLQELERGRS